jgi:hypothetical protein
MRNQVSLLIDGDSKLAEIKGIEVVIEAEMVDDMAVFTQSVDDFAGKQVLAKSSLIAQVGACNSRCHGNRVFVTKPLDDSLN